MRDERDVVVERADAARQLRRRQRLVSRPRGRGVRRRGAAGENDNKDNGDSERERSEARHEPASLLPLGASGAPRQSDHAAADDGMVRAASTSVASAASLAPDERQARHTRV